MSRRNNRGLLLLAILLISSSSFVKAQAPKPPATRVDNFREVVHGVEISGAQERSEPDGKLPVLSYRYGGFNVSQTPS